MDKEESYAAILYGTHASAHKEAEFIHTELSEQVHAGHVAVLSFKVVTSIQNLGLSPVAAISQVGRISILIFDFT